MKLKKLLGKKGFTLVEIMIVVAIIGLLAAVAVPNFIRARQRAQTNACIANLKQMEGAKTLYSLDGGANDPPLWADLVPDYIQRQPACPAAGAYTIGALAANPTCSVAGHAL